MNQTSGTCEEAKPYKVPGSENDKLSYRRDSAGRRSLRRSRSFKVTGFDTDRKSVCEFLLMINTNFLSYCILLIKFSLSTGDISL